MTGAPAGTCYGYAVRSALDFEYLRRGTGGPLDVSIAPEADHPFEGRPLVEWRAMPGEAPFHAKLFADGESYHLCFTGGHAGCFTIDSRSARIGVPDVMDVVRREERLWGIPALLCFLERGDLPLHAAAVEVDGEALLLAAPSHFGKTTLAAGFCMAGHRLLTEDLCCLRLSETPTIIPGPAMLRVRPDVAKRLEIPGARTVSEQEDRVHLALEDTDRGDCRPVPVRAIVLLRPSDDGMRLERVPPSEAIPELWALSFRVPTQAEGARCFAALVDLVTSVPVWNLFRPLRLEEMPATVEKVATGV